MSRATMTEKTFHVRSVSLPSQSHPTIVGVEEELHKLKSFIELSASTTSTMTMEMICNGLRHLTDIYDGIKDLLHLPSIQQGLIRSDQMKWLEKDVDGSMRLLDLCAAMKDAVAMSRQRLQDLQFALRRRGDCSTTEKVQVYIRSRKESNKIIKKSYKDLMRMDRKSQSSTLIFEDTDISVVMKVLNETRIICISLLSSIMSSIFMPKTKASWWSFGSKATGMTSEEDTCISCGSLRYADAEELQLVRNRLKAFENSSEEVENHLESLFRRLIQNRVSLLNILSL